MTEKDFENLWIVLDGDRQAFAEAIYLRGKRDGLREAMRFIGITYRKALLVIQDMGWTE